MEVLRPLIVLFLFCGLLLSISYLIHKSLNFGRRQSLLQAFIVVGGLVWFITELLSIFSAITFTGLISLWGIVNLVTLVLVVRISGRNVKKTILHEIRGIQEYLISLPSGLKVVLFCIFISIALLGLTAFVAAPNTWDSMTYHLSRVMHWEQNQSLAFYPTSIDRQLHLGPFAEMFILNFKVLAGTDHLANFVQFFAMIGCVSGVSLIAKRLGGNIYAQVFSSVGVATLPMGILQSTSTQTDYVLALWLVCFVSLMLEQLQVERPCSLQVLFMGIALGLAMITKATIFLFGVSFGLWFTFVLIKRFKVKVWMELLILLCAMLIVIAPHSFRNYYLYNNPLGPLAESGLEGYKITNDLYSFSAFSSNVLRNTAIHLALPFENLNNSIENLISGLHTVLNININSPKTTWPGTKFHVSYSTNENLAGNPFHLFLIIVSALSLTHYRKPRLVIFALSVATGFILFAWLFKWQPWHSRLHLPLFILSLPLAGLLISNYLNERRLYMAASVLFVLSIPLLLQNPTRPLVGANSILDTERLRQYFANRPDLYTAYEKQVEAVNALQCNDIGLMTGIDDWEYPIWVMTKAYWKNDIYFEHILVDNPSRLLNTEFVPCAIIATYSIQEKTIIYQNTLFGKLSEHKQISLFVPFVPSE